MSDLEGRIRRIEQQLRELYSTLGRFEDSVRQLSSDIVRVTTGSTQFNDPCDYDSLPDPTYLYIPVAIPGTYADRGWYTCSKFADIFVYSLGTSFAGRGWISSCFKGSDSDYYSFGVINDASMLPTQYRAFAIRQTSAVPCPLDPTIAAFGYITNASGGFLMGTCSPLYMTAPDGSTIPQDIIWTDTLPSPPPAPLPGAGVGANASTPFAVQQGGGVPVGALGTARTYQLATPAPPE